MNSEKIIQLLKSEPQKFTFAEIEQMMDEELAKDSSEMDTDFIDFCADLLCKALDAHEEKELNNKSENSKRIKLKLAKIVAIVALVALIMGFAVTVSAKYVYNDTSEKIVKFYEDHFSINLREANSNNDMQLDSSEDLIAKLKENGFDKVMLPSVLLTDDYTYTVDIVEDDEYISAVIDFENKNDNSVIYTTITKHKNGINKLLNSEIQMTAKYDSAKQLSLNGVDIFVFGNKETSAITYIDDNIDYDIELINYNFNSAVKTAESIKKG